MLKTIIYRELQNHLYSLRFIFALVLTLFLFGISSISFILDYKDQKVNYEQGVSKIRDNLINMTDNASHFAQNMNAFPFSPRNSSFIASCQEQNIPNTIIYTAFNVYGFDIGKGQNNPFILPTQEVNWEFILILMFTFLAIIFTFDGISGEKELRTLSLGLSNNLSRGTLLTGKFLGTLITLVLFLLLGIVESLAILIISGQVIINSLTMMEILGFLILAILLIACISSIGLLTSVLSRHANTSLIIGLMVWLVFMFIVPHTTLLLSNMIYPVQSSQVIQENTENSRNAIEASFPDGKWHSESDHPFTPDHQIRANMQMAFMLDEKKIKDNWYDSQFRQYQNTSYLTCISPMFMVEMADEQVLNGGFQRFIKNWTDLHTYQTQFLAWFKAFDAKDPKSPHWYNPYEDYSTSKAKINIDEVPVYKERTVSFAERLSGSAVYIALLLVYTAIAFFVSFVIFIRYDVR